MIGPYLVSWLWNDGPQPLCVCDSSDEAKAVVREKLGVTPEWMDGTSIWYAVLNIVHNGSTLQGVMIQQVPLYNAD